LWNVADWYRIK